MDDIMILYTIIQKAFNAGKKDYHRQNMSGMKAFNIHL